jgi:hypothetical protein
MEYKTTKRLFRNAYQYKVVLVCAGSSWFRQGNIGNAIKEFSKLDLSSSKAKLRMNHIRDQEDIDYGIKLANTLNQLSNFEIRVESPWMSIYTNDKSIVDTVVNLDKDRIKYVSSPPDTGIAENTIVMPKMNFDYKITLGKTCGSNAAFIEWAATSSKLRLTKSCIRDLSAACSWGGTYFYVSGDNNLLMVKMHLGGCISKIERIVKA